MHLQRRIRRGTLCVPQDVVRRELLWVRDKPDNKAISLLEEMRKWYVQGDLIKLIPEKIIINEQSAEEIVEMILRDIGFCL